METPLELLSHKFMKSIHRPFHRPVTLHSCENTLFNRYTKQTNLLTLLSVYIPYCVLGRLLSVWQTHIFVFLLSSFFFHFAFVYLSVLIHILLFCILSFPPLQRFHFCVVCFFLLICLLSLLVSVSLHFVWAEQKGQNVSGIYFPPWIVSYVNFPQITKASKAFSWVFCANRESICA